MAKRAWDVVISFAGLLVLLPLLGLIAVSVRFCDGSPILFRQRRVGLRGRPFTLYKFRTMWRTPGCGSASFDAGNTARVTRLGRFLRQSKLDELPQLWNVLRGDMSLVGPRPEVEQWVAAYPERWAFIHSVRPGITDPASIVYRNEERILGRAADPTAVYRLEILPSKLCLYEEYVRTRTFAGDLRIMFRTAIAVFRPQCF